MNSTNASSSNPSKKIKLTIIPPRQLFVNISSDEDITTTPSPTTTSSSPTPPNAPSKTTSTNQTSSSQENTSSSFHSKLQISPPSSHEPTSPHNLNPLLDNISDVPPRPLNPQPLQSHPSLDITLSLSPITPLDHIHDTPSPPSPPQPQPPIMGHPLFYNYHDYHGSTCILGRVGIWELLELADVGVGGLDKDEEFCRLRKNRLSNCLDSNSYRDPQEFSATTITLQTCDVATQGTKMVFVAALGFTAAAFWVVCLLSSWSTNVIFMVLVLFTDASLRIYVVHIFNNLLSMFRAIQIEPNESLVKAGISKKRISKRGSLRLKLRKLKRKPKSVVGHISAIVTRNPCTNGWYLDSGATVHVCDSRDNFVDYHKVTGKQVIMANSDRADVCGFGTVKLKFTSGKVITLQNVYHVPSIPKCLISVSKLDEHGFKITFESRKVVISKHGVFVGKGYILGGMYRVDDSSGSVGKTVKTNVSVVEPYFETNEKSVLPKGVRPIGSKWVFKKKLNPDGSISAFKARLVAKCYRQKEGIDYFDTYAPLARISSIRTLIAISAVKGLYIHQMDVKTDFLNGYLNEKVYMEQPEGFVIQGQENKVCRLVKSLYGLKQAPKSGMRVVICLYVDDMLIIGTTLDGILETKSYLSSNFKMKDLGEVDTILEDLGGASS
ncbi:zinc finger, CCHC-type containing protein [Tanacetum coccineum]